MPAHALEPLQGCTSVTECSDVQLHERLLSLPVGCLQMNAGFQVAACPRCSPVLSFCSPSVNQGQASRYVYNTERFISRVSGKKGKL